MGYYDQVKFEDLKGKTLVDIQLSEDTQITFVTSEGISYEMYHDQDCCEHVRIESIVGDLKDLLGHPLFNAEEVSNEDNQDYKGEYYDSYTWTFYKLATIKGYVDIRWLGESNGYYSESVSLHKGREYTSEEIVKMITKNNLKVNTTFTMKNSESEVMITSKEVEQPKKENKEVEIPIYVKKGNRYKL